VSVTGEFRRLVGACADFLETSDAPGAQQRADALRIAVTLAGSDLDAAAARVLAMVEDPERHPPIAFSTPAERDEYAQLWNHALAIVRALLGKAAV
jgi:hypothetical protein